MWPGQQGQTWFDFSKDAFKIEHVEVYGPPPCSIWDYSDNSSHQKKTFRKQKKKAVLMFYIAALQAAHQSNQTAF